MGDELSLVSPANEETVGHNLQHQKVESVPAKFLKLDEAALVAR